MFPVELITASYIKDACTGVDERETRCRIRGFDSASLCQAGPLTEEFAAFAASNVVQHIGLALILLLVLRTVFFDRVGKFLKVCIIEVSQIIFSHL